MSFTSSTLPVHIHHHDNSTSTNREFKVQGYKLFKPLRLVTRKKVLIVAFVRTTPVGGNKPSTSTSGADAELSTQKTSEDSIKLLM
eukprot:895218-Pyramimonas_sp.AAC.2